MSEDGGATFEEIARFIADPNNDPAPGVTDVSTIPAVPGVSRAMVVISETEGLSGVVNIPLDPQFTSDGSDVQIRFEVDGYAGGNEFLDFNEVTLTGTVPATQEICLTTTTNADGNYLFTGLADDTYEVRVDPNGTTLPAGVVQTAAPAGEALDNTSEVVVAGGVGSLDEDFGYQPLVISGTVEELSLIHI